MARKLSPAKRYLSCIVALAACALLSTAAAAEQRFQSPTRKAAAKSSITIRRPAPQPDNRPVPATQQSTTARDLAGTTAKGPRGSNSTPTNFRNPFSAEPGTSNAPLLLGPRSRWRSNSNSTHKTQPESEGNSTSQVVVKTRPTTPKNERSSSDATAGESAASQFIPRYTVPTVTPDAALTAPEPILQMLAEDPSRDSSMETATIAQDTSAQPLQDTETAAAAGLKNNETATTLPTVKPHGPQEQVVTSLEEEKAAPIRQAILGGNPSGATAVDLSRLPELQSFPGAAAVANAPQPKPPTASPPILQLADPRGFTTKPEQPIWLTNAGENSLGATGVDQATFNEPKPGSEGSTSKDFESAQHAELALSPDALAFAEETANSGDDDEPVIITDYNESPIDWVVQAKAAYQNAKSVDEFMACINLCQRVVNDGSSNEHSEAARKLAAEAYNRRGEMLSEAGKTAAALAEFETALTNDPESAQAIHNRAVTLAQENNLDAALADFNRVIELNPDLAMAYRNRAQLLVAQGKTEDAIADYTRAINTLKTDAEIYNSRAHALQELGRFDEAIADLKQSLEIDPHAAATYNQRANLLAERGEYENALADFKKSLELNPDLAETHRGLAWLRSTCPVDRHRDAFEALEAARNAVKLSNSEDYLTLEVLAAAHANAGEFDKAIETQRRCINHAPDTVLEELKRRLALYELRQPYRAKD